MAFRPRLGMATFFTLIIIALFALGNWIMDRPGAEPEPLQWRATYEERLWAPLREGNLTLADAGGDQPGRAAHGKPQAGAGLESRHG